MAICLSRQQVSFSVSVCGPFSFTEGFDLVSPNFSVLILLFRVYYLDVVAHTYNLSTRQAGPSLIVEGQSGLHRELQISQKSRATIR